MAGREPNHYLRWRARDFGCHALGIPTPRAGQANLTESACAGVALLSGVRHVSVCLPCHRPGALPFLTVVPACVAAGAEHSPLELKRVLTHDPASVRPE